MHNTEQISDSAVFDALWEQIEPTVFITREQFLRGLEVWAIDPVIIDGELAFVALTQGPEFHFASFDTGATITRTMIWSRLDAIMDQYGFVTTRTPKEGANRQHRINKALGFKEIESDEFLVTYRLDAPCRS